MSINNLNTYLNVRDAHLRVVSGNVYAQAMNIGGINVETAHGLQSVSNTGNATSLTLEFANVTTGFVTTANAQIGRDLVVTGNAAISKELTVTSNAIVSSNLNVSDDLVVTNNILASNNLTVTGNLNVTTVMSDSNVVTEYTGPHDRPLRKYPEIILPRAAVGADYNGYRIDRSSEHVTGAYLGVQKLFNETAVDYADTWGAGYNGTNFSYSASTGEHTTFLTGGTTQGTGANLSSSSGVPNGEWVSLKSPNAIKLDNIQIRSRNAGDWYGQFPTDFQIWGSNDGTTWSHIKTFTGQSASGQSTLHTYHINSTTFYNRHALVVTKIPGTASTIVVSSAAGHFHLSEIRFNGHEEGSGSLDTTLKSVYNVPATTGTQLEVYYDGRETSSYSGSGTTVNDLAGTQQNGTLNGGVGFDPTYKAFTFNGTTTRNITTTLPSSVTGEYVHSVSLWVKADEVSRSAGTGMFTFFTIGSASGTNMIALGVNLNSDGIKYDFYDAGALVNSPPITSNEWMHFVVTYSGGANNLAGAKRIYLNGKELVISVYGGNSVSSPLSLPTSPTLTLGGQLNSGNPPFSGSIANFRLYSKALNADQVKELYDYQKDYFLGSKSQVTLYKGHLGVGVTEPSGQLELAGDERLQEYPPRAFETTAGVNGPEDLYIEGHGHFKAWSTSYYNSNYTAGGAFTKSHSHTYDSWISAPGNWANGVNASTPGTGLPTASAPTFAGYKGSHLILELPYSILLKSFIVDERPTLVRQLPAVFVIIASNDGNNWDTIFNHTATAGVASDYDGNIFSVNATKTYSQYGFVALKNGNTNYDDHLAVGEWRLFGTPGPTTLDKGSLSLTRSLDVPRVSRYDVDTETPRPEKLILDLDTTVNSSPTDISGKGNHGTFNGGAYYSAADKAFTGFPSSNSNYINGNLQGVSGAYAHTQSYWINGADTTPRCPFTVGRELGSYSYLNIWLTTSQWTLNSDGAATGTWAETIYDNRWYHVVLTYDGGTSTDSYKLYIDGEYKTPTTAISINAALALPSNPEYRIGRNDGSQWYNGMVSNPKVYSVALEPSEVKKLYNLGRTGRSMVISDTAVGIGKVPEAQLDVRGIGKFDAIGIGDGVTNGPDTSMSAPLCVLTDPTLRGHSSWDLSRSIAKFGYQNGSNHYGISFSVNANNGHGLIQTYNQNGGGAQYELHLQPAGGVTKTNGSTVTSDDRVKVDETYIVNATETLMKLKPQTYTRYAGMIDKSRPDLDSWKRYEAGLITQEVHYDAPELRHIVNMSDDADLSGEDIKTSDDPVVDPDYRNWGSSVSSLDYIQLIPYLIKSNQELHAEIQALKHKDYTRELQIENNRLKNKVAILENRQTHFNTLLVNLTGRIETLERGT